MYKKQSTLFMLCETSLHAGSGDDLGIVDLPIQREKHTSFPKVESSSLKGALREAFEKADGKESDEAFQINIHRIFGYDKSFEKGITSKEDLAEKNTKDREFAEKRNQLFEPIKNYFGQSNEFAGSLAFTDARLLLFPVKSMKGVFVWITCPQVLHKFSSDMAIAGTPITGLDALKVLEVTDNKVLTASDTPSVNGAVVLEEYAFEATIRPEVRDFAVALSEIVFKSTHLSYWKGLLQKNLLVLSDTDFRDFVNMSTEVITRTKIDNETGTVQDGALFTEEYLPTDSVLYSLIFASDEYGKTSEKRKLEDADWVMKFFEEGIKSIKLFQLGGNATLGKGIIRTQLKQGGTNG
jgi:CRISPR-associated protein Cmr4